MAGKSPCFKERTHQLVPHEDLHITKYIPGLWSSHRKGKYFEGVLKTVCLGTAYPAVSNKPVLAGDNGCGFTKNISNAVVVNL